MLNFEEKFKKLLGDDVETYENNVVDDSIACDSNIL